MSLLVKFLLKFNIQQQLRKMSATCKDPLGKAVVAVGQMSTTNDKDANLCQVEELIKKAKAKGATMLFLPECCDYVAESKQQSVGFAEPLNGPTMAKYKELAKRNSMWISLGGIHEAILDESGNSTGKVHNAHVILNEVGELVTVYRKVHLFDAQTKDINLTESDTTTPGKGLLAPFSTPVCLMGLQICYDLRFAETALLLRKMGAQLITYPAAFTYTTGKAHWEILLRARAIETQCYVVAAAQQGQHNRKRRSWGHSMIIDPWGEVLADCGGDKSVAIGTATIDLSKLEQVRNSVPCFRHRRNDVYGLTAFNVPQTPNLCEDRAFAANVIDKRTIFYESEHCFAFTNLRCVVKGHVLVSTKRIVPRLNGLNCAEMTDLFATVCHIQRMLEDIYQTTSATVTVQDGSEAGQTVPHVHFHVMPRRSGDFGHNDQIYLKLDNHADMEPTRTIEERIEEAQKYRNYLQNADANK